MKLLNLLILSSLLLAGCQTTPPLQVIESRTKPNIDLALLQPCGLLVDNMAFGSSFEDVLDVKAKDALTFVECKDSKNKLIILIQEYLLK